MNSVDVKLRKSAVLVLGLLLATNAVALGRGIYEFLDPEIASSTLLGLSLIAVTLPVVAGVVLLSLSRDRPVPTHDGGSITEKQMVELLRTVSDRMLISDAAKRIAYREKDREALRKAIREDIDKRDYDAAMVLVTEMGRTYGYRLEAEQFREEIEAARAAELNQRITQAVAGLDQMLAQHDWDRAMAECAKIRRLFPDSPRVQELDARIAEAKEEHKKELQQQFLEAWQREDTELAMDLLKEMDRYLTPEEASPYLETARQVVQKKRANLGLQFKLACNEKDWTWALSVGEQLLEEFPNSKMAEEVRVMLPALRKRSSIEANATEGDESL